MNNKGFTVVELLASFTLTMIITTLLFEVVLELKDVYVSSELETAIKNENALIAREINKQIDNGNIPVECGGNVCTLKDNEVIEFQQSAVKVAKKTFEMPDDTYIDTYINENEDSMDIECPSDDGTLTFNGRVCNLKINYTVKSSNLSDGVTFNLVTSYLN